MTEIGPAMQPPIGDQPRLANESLEAIRFAYGGRCGVPESFPERSVIAIPQCFFRPIQDTVGVPGIAVDKSPFRLDAGKLARNVCLLVDSVKHLHRRVELRL